MAKKPSDHQGTDGYEDPEKENLDPPAPMTPESAFEPTAMMITASEDTEAPSSEYIEPPLMESTDLPAEGMENQIIDGRYKLGEILGEGGMGAVYRGTHMLMDKPVAVKLIRGQLAHIPEIAGRFQREAKSASRLTDPHCITVTDFGRTEDGTLFLVMELLDGHSLSDIIAEVGPLAPERAFRITKQILKALIHAHDAGVVHRDLKPGNVMLIKQGDVEEFVKVFDFGIAKIASDQESSDNLTQTGLIVGTPAYVAPEQATGEGSDQRADLYAVGVMLYEMLAGTRPFSGKTAVDVVYAHLSAPIPALPRTSQVPRGTQRVIRRALAKKSAERFQSAEIFFQALDQLDMEETSGPSLALHFVRFLHPIRSRISRFLARRFRSLSPTVLERLERLYASDLARMTDPVRQQLEKLPASKRRLLGRIVVGGLLFLMIGGGIAYYSSRQTFVEPAKLEAIEKPGVDEDAIERLFNQIDVHLASGLYDEANAAAQQALTLSPSQPVGHLLLGHVLFLSNQRREAMKSYARALGLDPSLAKDERLGTHLTEGLSSSSSRDAAAALLVKFGGPKGLEILAAQANSALSDVETRETVRQALVENGHEDEVDWVATLSADLNTYKSCRKRRQVIKAIIETKDPDFLPILRTNLEKAKADRGPSRLFRRLKISGSDKGYSCLTRDLKRAIKILSNL